MNMTEMMVQDSLPLVMKGMDQWNEEVQAADCVRINHSTQQQVYDYLRYKDVYTLTYDLRKDEDVTGSKRNVWWGLAYRMSLRQGVTVINAAKYAEENWRSIRSAVYALQSTSIASMPVLYATPHTKNGRDIEVVTFDGGYVLACGLPVAEVVSERDGKKWKAHLTKCLRKQGHTPEDAKKITGAVGVHVQIANQEQKKLAQ